METSTLLPVYTIMLSQQLTAEKKYKSFFTKISKSVQTQELRNAISPDGTEIENHISRLLRAMAAVKETPKATLSPLDEAHLRIPQPQQKGQSVLNDVQMLHHLKQIFSHKVNCYESLYQLARALGQEEYVTLLEQSCKDNQNSLAYLNQIAQNVIYPGAR